jgi:hypothetical protein
MLTTLPEGEGEAGRGGVVGLFWATSAGDLVFGEGIGLPHSSLNDERCGQFVGCMVTRLLATVRLQSSLFSSVRMTI